MEHYGMDEDAPLPDTDEDVLTVPEIPCPLTEDSLQDLRAAVDPLKESNQFGRELYLATIDYVQNAY
jgi:hypothetical protein